MRIEASEYSDEYDEWVGLLSEQDGAEHGGYEEVVVTVPAVKLDRLTIWPSRRRKETRWIFRSTYRGDVIADELEAWRTFSYADIVTIPIISGVFGDRHRVQLFFSRFPDCTFVPEFVKVLVGDGTNQELKFRPEALITFAGRGPRQGPLEQVCVISITVLFFDLSQFHEFAGPLYIDNASVVHIPEKKTADCRDLPCSVESPYWENDPNYTDAWDRERWERQDRSDDEW